VHFARPLAKTSLRFSLLAMLLAGLVFTDFDNDDKFLGLASAATDSIPKIEWRLLRGLNYKTGELSITLKQLNKHVVRMAGFMVPLEDEDDNVSEFLLVPWVGACIHTPPPPPNQIVDVHASGSKKIKVDLEAPIWVQGHLDISTVKSPYGDVSFQMTDSFIEPYEEK
jgi:hypothetical protein